MLCDAVRPRPLVRGRALKDDHFLHGCGDKRWMKIGRASLSNAAAPAAAAAQGKTMMIASVGCASVVAALSWVVMMSLKTQKRVDDLEALLMTAMPSPTPHANPPPSVSRTATHPLSPASSTASLAGTLWCWQKEKARGRTTARSTRRRPRRTRRGRRRRGRTSQVNTVAARTCHYFFPLCKTTHDTEDRLLVLARWKPTRHHKTSDGSRKTQEPGLEVPPPHEPEPLSQAGRVHASPPSPIRATGIASTTWRAREECGWTSHAFTCIRSRRG